MGTPRQPGVARALLALVLSVAAAPLTAQSGDEVEDREARARQTTIGPRAAPANLPVFQRGAAALVHPEPARASSHAPQAERVPPRESDPRSSVPVAVAAREDAVAPDVAAATGSPPLAAEIPGPAHSFRTSAAWLLAAAGTLVILGCALRARRTSRTPVPRTPALPASLLALAMLGSASAQTAPDPIRVALRARGGGADRLTPLRYVGGFETKTLVYETLVRRGSDGRLAPGLASRWAIDPDGKTFHFEIREGARFHDGTLVTPEALRVHFKRWVGLPEHDWLLANHHIVDVQAESERAFRITTDQPYSLLGDLCVINPCAIVGPGARDWEGEFQRPMGTGPFRFVSAQADGKRWRLARNGSEGPDLEICFYPRGRDVAPLDALREGTIDAFVGGWDEDLPSERLDAVQKDERLRLVTTPGSSVVYLSFALGESPTRTLAIRQRIAAAIDRAALIKTVEGTRADPCTSWAAPSLAAWPRPRIGPAPRPVVAADAAAKLPPLTVAAARREGRAGRVAAEVVRQLNAAGVPAQLVASTAPDTAAAELPRKKGVGDSGEVTARPPAGGNVNAPSTDSGEARAAANREQRAMSDRADIRVEITHGSPYDPYQSLISRFGPPRPGERPRTGVDVRLFELVVLLSTIPDESQTTEVCARIQELMDAEALIVPLYAPWRIAVHSAAVEGIRLGTDVYSVDLTGLRRVESK